MVVVPQDTRHTSGTREEDINLPSSNATGDNLDTIVNNLFFDFHEELGPRNTWKLLDRLLSTYPAQRLLQSIGKCERHLRFVSSL